MKNILAHLQQHHAEILADVETLVRIETPSNHPQAVNQLQDIIQKWMSELGTVTRHTKSRGDILHAHVQGEKESRILILGHVDTVYQLGTWKNNWEIKDKRAYGPGAYDMKAGLIQGIWALRTLQALNIKPTHSVDFLFTADEELGSEESRAIIEELASGAHAVFVLEAPFMNGDLKIARKGVGDYILDIHGKAAHQGVEPENGRNAIISAAHIIQQIVKLQDLEKGTTLGPNVIRGGSASNVVADHVTLEVDLRAWTLAEAERVHDGMEKLAPLVGTRVEINGGLNRPPMEPTEGSQKLFDKAKQLAKQIGFEVGASRVGGGSDGNFTSLLAPTLDGLGTPGANGHQKDLEYIEIDSLAPRTALLTGLLLD